jgi:hypothetical protein
MVSRNMGMEANRDAQENVYNIKSSSLRILYPDHQHLHFTRYRLHPYLIPYLQS